MPSQPVPEWIQRFSDAINSPLDQLNYLGFWDMEDGGRYDAGRWNPHPWEMWERNPVLKTPDFPAAFKRAYESASPEDRVLIDEGMSQLLGLIEEIAKDQVTVSRTRRILHASR